MSTEAMQVKDASGRYAAAAEAQDVPPGYKRTEVGVIPEDWRLVSLKKISDFITKGSTPTTYGFKWETQGVLFLRSECVSEAGLDLEQSMFISDAAHALLRRSEVRDGDILITITGNVGRAIYLAEIGTANINQHIARVRLLSPDADGRYVFHYLSQESVRQHFTRITTGQAYPQISLEQVRDAAVPLPRLKEQRAIAEVLSDVDGLLASLEALVAKKRAIKQAAMQQLLTGKTRLPGFSGEWETKRLGEIGSTFGSLTGKSKNDFGHGNARYITFMNIMSNTVIDCDAFEPVVVKQNETQNRVLKGDLFFNGSSETPEEVGMCAVLMDDVHEVYLNSFCFGFRLREEARANGLYLAYVFRSQQGRELLKSLAQGATRYNLSKTALLALRFPLPDLEEQRSIATVLSDIDAEIAALEARRDKTRALKQGMMQQLLTGRVRLFA